MPAISRKCRIWFYLKTSRSRIAVALREKGTGRWTSLSLGLILARTLAALLVWTLRAGLFCDAGCGGARWGALSRVSGVALWRWRRAAAPTLWAGCLPLRDTRSA